MIEQEFLWTPVLADYVKSLNDKKRQRVKKETAARLVNDARYRMFARIKFQKWLKYFHRCELTPNTFLRDPLLIDIFVIDVTKFAELVDPKNLLWLQKLLNEAKKIAQRTRPARLAMLCSAANSNDSN